MKLGVGVVELEDMVWVSGGGVYLGSLGREEGGRGRGGGGMIQEGRVGVGLEGGCGGVG